MCVHPFSAWDLPLIHVTGPIVGGAFPKLGDHTPRAVIPEYFYEICKDREIIGSYAVNGPLADASAEALIQAWMQRMAPHRCVEVELTPPEVFDEQ